MRKAFVYFRWWIVRLLGGESTKYVQVPVYRPEGPMTETDWQEIVDLRVKFPGFYKWLNSHMADIEHKLLVLDPEADRERLIVGIRLAECLQIMNLPLLAAKELKRLEGRLPASTVMNNLGTKGG